MAEQDLTLLSKQELIEQYEQLQEALNIARDHCDQAEYLVKAYERILDKGITVNVYGTSKENLRVVDKVEKPSKPYPCGFSSCSQIHISPEEAQAHHDKLRDAGEHPWDSNRGKSENSEAS